MAGQPTSLERVQGHDTLDWSEVGLGVGLRGVVVYGGHGDPLPGLTQAPHAVVTVGVPRILAFFLRPEGRQVWFRLGWGGGVEFDNL